MHSAEDKRFLLVEHLLNVGLRSGLGIILLIGLLSFGTGSYFGE